MLLDYDHDIKSPTAGKSRSVVQRGDTSNAINAVRVEALKFHLNDRYGSIAIIEERIKVAKKRELKRVAILANSDLPAISID